MHKHKRKIAVLASVFVMALFALTSGLAFPAGALAWDDCPKGIVNDPYPGVCRRYVDTNNDGICDLSQPEPAAATTTTTKQPETTTTTSPAVATTTSGTPPTGDCPLGPCSSCGACISAGVSASSEAVSSVAATGTAVLASYVGSGTTSTTTPPSGGGSDGSSISIPAAESTSAAVAVAGSASGTGFLTHYLVSPIALGFLIIYGVSFWLYRSKRIRLATHRKVWNVLLLATFLITGIFGTILAVQLDYAPTYTWPVNLLFWHVEAGVVMTFISIFHMAWHFKYYKGILKNAREKWRLFRETQREADLNDGVLVAQAREARRAERENRRTPGSPAAARPQTTVLQQQAQPVWQQPRPVANPGGARAANAETGEGWTPPRRT